MKKIMIGALVPIAASLGVWLAIAPGSAAHPARGTVTHQTVDTNTEPEDTGGEPEDAADAAAQHAACLSAGINDEVTPNVQYDDQTGACSLDTGTDNEDD